MPLNKETKPNRRKNDGREINKKKGSRRNRKECIKRKKAKSKNGRKEAEPGERIKEGNNHVYNN